MVPRSSRPAIPQRNSIAGPKMVEMEYSCRLVDPTLALEGPGSAASSVAIRVQAKEGIEKQALETGIVRGGHHPSAVR